ncbi:MAG TPA: hypothetical protein VGK25_07975 [Ignavibacteria bacterium]|jgi:hypothetical protein
MLNKMKSRFTSEKKIISITALILILALGFLYLNQSRLIADDRDGKKSCTIDKSSCTEHKVIKAGGEWSSYEFVTDKACCEEMKTQLQTDLMSVAGVKEVKFGPSCSVSKMSQVTIYYAAGETSEETLAAYLKDKNYDCSGHSGCDKDGTGSHKECPHKESNQTKQL